MKTKQDKIISWNLNGLKSSIKKGFYSAIDSMKPDVICCQESRTVRMKLDLQGYSCFWNVSEKPSYAGLLAASKVKFLDLNAESISTVENPVGFLTDDRDSFERILELGYTDAFRFLYPNKREYTWICNYKSKEQEISIGTRIDYFLVSNLLTDKIKDVIIHQNIECSDHRPTELLIDIDL